MSPYRSSVPVADVPEVIPWWQRAWFRVNRADAVQRWQWARRAIGGRWTRELADSGRTAVWRRRDACPAADSVDVVGIRRTCSCCCPINAGMCHARTCYCEVWS